MEIKLSLVGADLLEEQLISKGYEELARSSAKASDEDYDDLEREKQLALMLEMLAMEYEKILQADKYPDE